jgi:hypothetical protein
MECRSPCPLTCREWQAFFFEIFAFARPSLSIRQNIIVRRPWGAVDCVVCIILDLLQTKKAIAESTLKADNIGRTLLRDLARVLEASGTETVRGPFSLP